MAQMIIEIPDNRVVEVLDALSTAWGYTSETGLTKAQFVRTTIMQHLILAFKRGKRAAYEGSFVPPADPAITVQ